MRAIILIVLSVACFEFAGISETLAQASAPGIPKGVTCVSNNSREISLGSCPTIDSKGTRKCLVTGNSCTWVVVYTSASRPASVTPPGMTSCDDQFADDCKGNTCTFRYHQCTWPWLRHIMGQ
jgi:hypothetical protein